MKERHMTRKKAKTFAEWIKDPKNDAAFLRELERLGIVESFIGPDGKIWCRRVDKPPLKPPGTGEKLDS